MLQKILSLLAGIISAAMMIVIMQANSWWMFLGVLLLWLGILVGITAYLNVELEKKFVNLPLVVLTIVGLTGLILVSEWNILRWFIVAATGAIMFFVFSHMEGGQTGLSYELKPVRRMVMMLWIFDLYALSVLVYAMDVFFQSAPFWFMSLLLSSIYGMVSIKIWRMYFVAQSHGFVLLAATVGLIVWEIVYVMRFLPLGYFLMGVLAVWVWYVMHLFIRFHLSQQGIVWKKQALFLIVNFILFLLALMFFVKWI